MSKPFILALTGPVSSGKTTVASRLAREIDHCVNIDADYLKHFIVNDFIYGNEPDGVSQWELLGTNIGILAKNFHEAGYNIIINGYINEPAWKNIYKHVTFDRKVLLLPRKDALLQRDTERQDGYSMGAEAVEKHHDYFLTAPFMMIL